MSDGQIAIDFTDEVQALQGAEHCTHVVHIDQHLWLATTGEITVGMTRIGLATIESVP